MAIPVPREIYSGEDPADPFFSVSLLTLSSKIMTLGNDEIRMTAEALRDVYGAMETNDEPGGRLLNSWFVRNVSDQCYSINAGQDGRGLHFRSEMKILRGVPCSSLVSVAP